jgi:hypothetical protein
VSIAWASLGFAQEQSDSAGVTVVYNPPAVEAELDWMAEPEPRVEIGGSPDDARYQLYRVVDAARLSDGRIVVANGGNYELRLYDGDGVYISAVGREGGGPGEFRRIWGLDVGASDSIYVFDRSLQRVSIFDAQGELARELRIPSSLVPLAHVGRFADGRWYARDEDELRGGPAGSIQRDTTRYTGVDAGFTSGSLITMLPGMMTVIFDGSFRTAPFSPVPAQDEYGDCLYIVAGDDFDVRIFSSDGRLQRIVRNAGERRAVSEALRAAWMDDMLGEIPEAARPQARQVMEGIPAPDELPVYNKVQVDPLGYIWLQEYSPPHGVGRWWIVLEPNGTLLGRVEMPARFDVYDVGADYVLGRWRDELGEEFVRLYAMALKRDPQLRPLARCTAP